MRATILLALTLIACGEVPTVIEYDRDKALPPITGEVILPSATHPCTQEASFSVENNKQQVLWAATLAAQPVGATWSIQATIRATSEDGHHARYWVSNEFVWDGKTTAAAVHGGKRQETESSPDWDAQLLSTAYGQPAIFINAGRSPSEWNGCIEMRRLSDEKI